MVDFRFRAYRANDADDVEAHFAVDTAELDIVVDGLLETLHLPVVDGFLRFTEYPTTTSLNLYEHNGSGFIFGDDVNVATP